MLPGPRPPVCVRVCVHVCVCARARPVLDGVIAGRQSGGGGGGRKTGLQQQIKTTPVYLHLNKTRPLCQSSFSSSLCQLPSGIFLRRFLSSFIPTLLLNVQQKQPKMKTFEPLQRPDATQDVKYDVGAEYLELSCFRTERSAKSYQR